MNSKTWRHDWMNIKCKEEEEENMKWNKFCNSNIPIEWLNTNQPTNQPKQEKEKSKFHNNHKLIIINKKTVYIIETDNIHQIFDIILLSFGNKQYGLEILNKNQSMSK